MHRTVTSRSNHGDSLKSGTAVEARPPGIDEQERAIFAELLSSARRRSGRSLQQIAEATKISSRHLTALEAGRAETLPGGVYRRAIVREYATRVGLDPHSLLERFDRTFGDEAALPDLRDLQRKLAPPARLAPLAGALAGLPRRRWALGSVVAVAVAAAGYAVGTRALLQSSAEAPAMGPVVAAMERQDVFLRAEAPSTAARSTTGTSGAAQTDGTSEAFGIGHRLVITSQPEGARVTVNGIGWGVTPLTISHLPAGDKVVRLTKDGYVARERRVRLDGTAGSSAVRVTLRPRG